MKSKITRLQFLLLMFFTLSVASTYSQTIRYVKETAAGTGNGTSWANASADLQAMINLSVAGDEVWVAAGIYKPNRKADDLNVITPGNRLNSFVLKEGVKVYGSFTGIEESLNERSLPSFSEGVNYTSVLSGDFAGNDIINGAGSTLEITNIGENAHHVVISVGTIDNPLSANTVVDGFKVVGANANPDFGYLLIINGHEVSNADGAGILNINSNITISRMTIIGNVALGTGGAMYNINSSPAITDVVMDSNEGGDGGGGIANFDSSPTITNVFIKNNKGVGIYGTYNGGGGMLNSNSSPIVENTSINGNMSSYAGGVANYNSYAVFTNVIIDGNYTNYGTSAGDGGGGMLNYLGAPTLTNVTISNNNADGYGGGIQNNNSSPLMTDVVVTGNTCSDGGGGIFNYTASPILNNVQINNNSVSNGEGGGILNRQMAAPVLTNVTINDNTGSGISMVEDSSVTITGGVIEGNSERGIYIWSGAASTFTDVIVNDNSNGGIFNIYSNSSFTNITITNNTGRGIYTSNSSAVFTNCTITGNMGQHGAGVFNIDASTSFIGCTISNNIASDEGGGMKNYDSAVIILDCEIQQNTATEGGGIFNYESTPTIKNTSIHGNTAFFGGGMYNEDSSPLITNVVFSGNNANGSGGAMYNRTGSPILTNVTISGNKSTSTISGAVYNTYNSSPVFRNSIIWGNSSGVNSGPFDIPTYHYSLVQGMTTGLTNGNMSGNTDPMFTDAPSFTTAPFISGDYTLQPVSPVIGAGNNVYFSAGQVPDLSTITTDLAGNDRIQLEIIDMGAYEYTEPCATPAPQLENYVVCTASTVADLPSAAGLQWYATEEAEEPLNEDAVLQEGIYYVSQTLNDCESPRVPVEVSLNIVPVPSGPATQVIGSDLPLNAIVADLDAEGQDIQWYASEQDMQNGNILPGETVLVINEDYYATQTISGCESAPLIVTVTSLMGTADFNTVALRYYPNPIAKNLQIQYSADIDFVTVYTLQGQKIIEQQWNSPEGTLDLSSLSTGSYIINVQSQNTSGSFLIVKTIK